MRQEIKRRSSVFEKDSDGMSTDLVQNMIRQEKQHLASVSQCFF